MTIDKNRVVLAGLITIAALFLHGCASTDTETDAVTTAAPVAVESDDVSETVRIIDRLDKAGCDFAGVNIIRGEVRKYHGEIHVSCRENPSVIY